MNKESEEKLHRYLYEELNVIALNSEMKEIEYISCQRDLQLLNKVKICYDKLGYLTSDILVLIESRLDEVPKSLLI